MWAKRILLVSILLLMLGSAFALPTTTFESFQVEGTTDQNITLTCTDNNSGCKTINYNINNEGWNNIIVNNIFNFPKIDLFANYNLNETTGTTAYNNVAGGDNLTNVGTANINQTGKIDTAYTFDGSNDYLKNDTFFASHQAELTFSAWVYPTALDGDAITIFSFRRDADSWDIFSLFQQDTTAGLMFVGSHSSKHENYVSGASLNLNEWNFVVLQVKDANCVQIWINNDRKLNTCNNRTFNNTMQRFYPAVYAWNKGSMDWKFNGTMDEISVWNRILTTDELTELYNNGIGLDYNYQAPDFSNYSFLYSGAGDHNIQYYSTDNADNNETIKTSTFKTYGLAKFTFYDEDTESLLNDVVYTISPSINGDSGGTLTDSNTLDLNLQGITSQEYTFTFTKTGYGTRTYVKTLTQYSELDVNFALLSTTLSDDIPFKIYQTDETTIYTNTIIELYRPDNNFIIGRKKTNTTGNVTFSIHVSDQNYYVRVDDGAFTYQPVALTIYYPKNEETLEQITEDWKIEITQNLYETYSDLNADKIIYLLPNTSLPFNIRISDMNGNYFTRTYAQQFLGNPLTATLQPYLVSTATGLLTTITTKDATTNTNVGGVTIKIYKFISGEGKTLVEQVITDAKGQAITLLIAGAEYSFECYYGGVLIKTFEITSTSTTIYIMLDFGDIIDVPDPNGYQATFTPKGTGLTNQGVGTVAFGQTIYNYGGETISLTSRIIQNGVVISQQTANTSLTSYTFTHTINWIDINQPTITSRIIVNDGTTNYTFNQEYKITTFFDTNYSILNGLQTGLRSDLSCDATGICFPLLALAIFISIALVIGATIGLGQFGVQSVAIIFLTSMMLFTYLNWVPFILTIVLAVLTFAFIVSERSV